MALKNAGVVTRIVFKWQHFAGCLLSTIKCLPLEHNGDVGRCLSEARIFSRALNWKSGSFWSQKIAGGILRFNGSKPNALK